MALEFTARRSEPAARRVPSRQLLRFPLLQAITAALLFCRHCCTCTSSSCYCHNHRSTTIGLIIIVIIVIITVAAAITGRTLLVIIIITATRLLSLLLREPMHLPRAEPHLLRGTTAVTWSQ